LWGRGPRVEGEKEEVHLHSPLADNELIQLVCPAGRWRTEAVAALQVQRDNQTHTVKQSEGELKGSMRQGGEKESLKEM